MNAASRAPARAVALSARPTGRSKGSELRWVDEHYTGAAKAGDSSPAVMGDGLNPLTMR
jgi:hypothetical protein